MDLSLSAVYSAMNSAQQALEANAQDLANVHTHGYRPQQTYFESAMQTQWAGAGGAQETLPWAVQLNQGEPSTQPGPLQSAHGPLNAALSDPNDYFCVMTPQGLAYTRDGAFVQDAQGAITDAHGNPVMGTAGPLAATGGPAVIAANGSLQDGSGDLPQNLLIVNLKGMDLKRQGTQLFTLAAGQDGGPAQGRIMAGQLEGSGSDIFKGMSDLVVLMRWSESVQKAARASDDAANTLVQTAKLA